MPRPGEFRVSVTKDYLVFASAHFITFAGHRCEGLHGHNYRARVTVEGALDEESWFVFDFVVLKKIMRRLCDEIDHKVLLPLENPKIQLKEEGDSIHVAYEGKPRYVFPKGDCALLRSSRMPASSATRCGVCSTRRLLPTRAMCTPLSDVRRQADWGTPTSRTSRTTRPSR